jgi:HD-like signal output (HDOD) protein
MHDEAFSSAKSVLHRIPPFPAALGMILQSCASDNPSAAEVARAVAKEEVLAAKVVAVANAAVMAPVQQVENVTAAVSRLGIAAVRTIAMGFYLTETFSRAFSRSGLDRVSLWRHNLAVAAASSGSGGGAGERSNAYFAGLMHDVGKMILAAELGHAYGDCVAEAARTGSDVLRVETKRLGVTHARIGAEAAAQWNFGPEVVEAIQHHHDVFGAGKLSTVAARVLVGNQVANEMGMQACSLYTSTTPATIASTATGIGAGIMSKARWALTQEVPRIEAMLSAMLSQ